MLALAALFVTTRHRREAQLWMGIAVVEVLLSLGPATPLGALFYYVPGFSNFQAPLRHLFLVSLCLAVGSGLAFAELTRERERRRMLAATALITTLLGGAAFVVFAWRTAAVRALIESHARLRAVDARMAARAGWRTGRLGCCGAAFPGGSRWHRRVRCAAHRDSRRRSSDAALPVAGPSVRLRRHRTGGNGPASEDGGVA